MNIENSGILSRQIAGDVPTAVSSIEEDDRQQEHFKTDHLLPNLKGHTISSGAVTVSAQGAKFFLNLVSTVILARLLSPRDFGLVAMVTTVTGFLRVFKDAGLSMATVQRERITHTQVSNLFWINVGVSTLTSFALAPSAPMIAWFYHNPRLIPINLFLSLTFLKAAPPSNIKLCLNGKCALSRWRSSKSAQWQLVLLWEWLWRCWDAAIGR